MYLANHSVLSPNGETLDNVLVESPDDKKCEHELYALTIAHNKVFCLKCHSRFKATNRTQNGRRVFLYDSPIPQQIENQLQHQIVTAKIAESQLVG
ncbi:MAG: hypothetical protein WCP93_01880 [Candidatus Berkelbacteria bacterium]